MKKLQTFSNSNQFALYKNQSIIKLFFFEFIDNNSSRFLSLVSNNLIDQFKKYYCSIKLVIKTLLHQNEGNENFPEEEIGLKNVAHIDS